MAANFVAGGEGGLGDRRVAGQCHGDGENGDRDVMAAEQLEQAPDPDTAAVFVDRLHAHVTRARPRLGAYDLGQESLRRGVAMEDIVFAAFLIVDHELDGQSRTTRPVRVWRVGTITDQIAWMGFIFHALFYFSRGSA